VLEAAATNEFVNATLPDLKGCRDLSDSEHHDSVLGGPLVPIEFCFADTDGSATDAYADMFNSVCGNQAIDQAWRYIESLRSLTYGKQRGDFSVR
jgi:hypothetical protein